MKIIDLTQEMTEALGRAPTAEELAMAQALYSRDPGPIEERMERFKNSGATSFMDKFYVGYGHPSIGDCGSTTLCFQGVSMLAAKAIQDSPLYSGQESSTRYIDFSSQPFIDPIGTQESHAHLERWREFYLKNLPRLIEAIKAKYPAAEDSDQKQLTTYRNTVKAKAFDIMRAFLPAGASTNLSWHSNLRQLRDKLTWLRHHPDAVIRQHAADIQLFLHERHPGSGFLKTYAETEAHAAEWSKYLLWKPDVIHRTTKMTTYFDEDSLAEYAELLKNRPYRAAQPPLITEVGMMRFDYVLDFASFRDLQRHRPGVNRIPLLTDKLGFHSWYLSQLTEEIEQEALALLEAQHIALDAICDDEVVRQYYIPMGYLVPCRMQFPLHSMLYMFELRTGQTVHPTARHATIEMYTLFHKAYPDIVAHVDLDDTNPFNMKRGTQTITEKT
ncbi:MAG TPA: FAD-dependent thymidylate synthase [bacterium]|nr:FAD-dependent thymidylate synthase [Candidatus Magasanikbacteria bacterium]HPF95368.1 FAD-dependent thymidylate synthase [bacterium]